MRHEFAPEVNVSSYHDVDRGFRAREVEKKLPRGVSVLVIAALSVLSWAVIVMLGMALSSFL